MTFGHAPSHPMPADRGELNGQTRQRPWQLLDPDSRLAMVERLLSRSRAAA